MDVFKRFKIRNILFLSFFVFMVIVFIVIIVFSYKYSVDKIVSSTSAHQKENLSLLSDDLKENMDNFEELSLGISRQKSFQNAVRGSENKYENRDLFTSLSQDMAHLVYSIPGLHSIQVYTQDPPSVNIQLPITYHAFSDLEKAEWEERIENKSTAWLGVRKVSSKESQLTNKEDVLSFGRKVYSGKGDLEVLLIINISQKHLENWLQNKSNDQNRSELLLLDTDGTTIASSNTLREEERPDYSGRNIVNNQNRETDNTNETVQKNPDHLAVSSEIIPNNWTLTEITSLNELTVESRNMAWWLTLIGFVSIVIAFLGTLFITRKFSEPIIQLSELLNKYPEQNVLSKLPGDYKNEYGKLFDGYRALIIRSDSLYDSLIEQHQLQREAETKALQANINPHFLYNTLDQLNWSAIEHGYTDMSRKLELLGEMLRIGLSKGKTILTVEEELEYLDYYLQIQEIQQEHRIKYNIKIHDRVRRYLIPKLTLQPFIENSIMHGFRSNKEGSIDIFIREDGESLLIQILDDGCGFSNLETHNSGFHTGGYGIRNVSERLDIYFGKQATIDISNRKEGGTAVSIRIPKVVNINKIQHTPIQMKKTSGGD